MLERGRTNFNDVRAKYTEKAPSRWSVRERDVGRDPRRPRVARPAGAFGQNEISRVNFRFLEVLVCLHLVIWVKNVSFFKMIIYFKTFCIGFCLSSLFFSFFSLFLFLSSFFSSANPQLRKNCRIAIQ